MTNLLSRRLPTDSALLVGRRVATNAAAFADAHGPLAASLTTLVAEVSAATDALATEGAGTSLFVLDRVADRAVANLAREIDARASALAGDEVLPLSAAEKAERDAAETLASVAFPKGTGFLQLPYGAQYLAMDRLLKSLHEKGAKAAVKSLGLEAVVARVGTVVKAYGEALGVGGTQKSAGSAAASDAWHEAYEALLLGVLSTYRKTAKRDAAEEAFVAPYTEESERLRTAERKARRTKKDAPDA